MAGPWSVVPLPGEGHGLFRAGETPERGYRPVAVFPDRFLALLAAAVLPGTGREPLLTLGGEADAGGYPAQLDDGTVVGHLAQFDEALLESINVLAAVVRQPASLAFELEAAGAVVLERCGAKYA